MLKSMMGDMEAVKSFESGDPPPTDEALAERINAPVRVVHELSYQLVTQGILRQVYPKDGMDPGLMPARDPGVLTARDVLGAIRNYGDPCALPAGEEANQIYRLMDRAEEEATQVLAKSTLKELARKNGKNEEGKEPSTEERGPGASPPPEDNRLA